ncbi:MAG: hypothetical protein KatS3mg010_0944 [Acidimicrobiia bacterium]|nr:MAG: hypothetical protein KatS3mg010_0944 [Acidimicrobiia bacterium]
MTRLLLGRLGQRGGTVRGRGILVLRRDPHRPQLVGERPPDPLEIDAGERDEPPALVDRVGRRERTGPRDGAANDHPSRRRLGALGCRLRVRARDPAAVDDDRGAVLEDERRQHVEAAFAVAYAVAQQELRIPVVGAGDLHARARRGIGRQRVEGGCRPRERGLGRLLCVLLLAVPAELPQAEHDEQRGEPDHEDVTDEPATAPQHVPTVPTTARALGMQLARTAGRRSDDGLVTLAPDVPRSPQPCCAGHRRRLRQGRSDRVAERMRIAADGRVLRGRPGGPIESA